jgi:septal ring factor EnvC (AmiA/AmiB activator)
MNKFILDKLDKVEEKIEEIRVHNSRLEESIKSHELVDEKIHESIKSLAEKMLSNMSNMSQSLGEYNVLLDQHMRRTEITEENLQIFRDEIRPILELHMNEKIIKEHKQNTFKKYMKYIAGITAILSMASYILKLLEVF